MHDFAKAMLDWYARHGRSLPWRVPPSDRKNGVLPDPYHVWLSEVMLQQTTVVTVGRYFQNFLQKWPAITDLAAAETDDVMVAWAGLGYYSRARNLKACAEIIARDHNGCFPQTKDELEALPGIGDYTAAAIAAIAFGERTAVVDGNIERVVTRQLAEATPPPTAKAICRTFMGRVTPQERPGDFVQAMMDLGATICTPRKPACARCPIAKSCRARRQGTMLDFPVKPQKKAKPTRRGAAFIAQRQDGAIWLVRRPDKGMLGGMAGLPTTDWSSKADGSVDETQAPGPGPWRRIGTVKHTFTHFHLAMDVFAAEIEQVDDDGWWCMLDALDGAALPTLFRKAIDLASEN